MADKRRKNINWSVADDSGNSFPGEYKSAHLAVLMDIRDELQELNKTLGCFRVRRMCDDVNRIDKRLREHVKLKTARKRA